MIFFSLIAAAGLNFGQTPQKPEPLFAGTGSHVRKISTTNPLAQRYFDQGMAFLYGFNHGEAERSFRAATQADPKCGMAWFGLAISNGPHINNPSVDADGSKAAVD